MAKATAKPTLNSTIPTAILDVLGWYFTKPRNSPADAAMEERAKKLAKGDRKAAAEFVKSDPASAEFVLWAAAENRVEVLEKVLGAGADPNEAVTYTPRGLKFTPPSDDFYPEQDIPEQETHRALSVAVIRNHVDAVRVLLDHKADPNLGRSEHAPLEDAVRSSRTAIAQLLIERGAKVKNLQRRDRSLLQDAAWGDDAKLIPILLKAGLDPNHEDDGGFRPLIGAASRGNVTMIRELVAAGAVVDALPSKGNGATLMGKTTIRELQWTPLMYAAEGGHAEAVRELIKAGADPARKDANGNTAVDIAQRHSHRNVIEVLRGLGATKKRKAKPINLIQAADAGDVESIREALDSGVGVDDAANDMLYGGDTALMIASLKGNADAVELLLERGANVEARGELKGDAGESEEFGAMFSMLGAFMGKMEGAKKRSKQIAAAASTKGKGNTALYKAARGGYADVVKLLLEAGADPNAIAYDLLGKPEGMPLHAAASNGHVEVVRLLLDHGGAKRNDKTGGKTPTELASKAGHEEVFQLLSGGKALYNRNEKLAEQLVEAASKSDLPTVTRLLAKGADPNAPSRYATPLRAAVGAGAFVEAIGSKLPKITAVIDALIKAGGDVNRPSPEIKSKDEMEDQDGETPLCGAAMHPALVEVLLKRGADPNGQSVRGWTPMFFAVAMDRPRSVKLLLEAGANPDVINPEEGQTCLDAAEEMGHKKCKSLLERAGAKRASELKGAGAKKKSRK